jgi:hypothetical protein
MREGLSRLEDAVDAVGFDNRGAGRWALHGADWVDGVAWLSSVGRVGRVGKCGSASGVSVDTVIDGSVSVLGTRSNMKQ